MSGRSNFKDSRRDFREGGLGDPKDESMLADTDGRTEDSRQRKEYVQKAEGKRGHRTFK